MNEYHGLDIDKVVQGKIQAVIDEVLYNWMKEHGIYESAELINIPDCLDLELELKKRLGIK